MQASLRAFIALVTFIGLTSTAAAATSVSILDLAADAGAVDAGASTTVPFKANFRADGFGCPQGGQVTLALNVTGTPPPGVIVAVEPAEVTISIPAGLYANVVDGAPVAPFNGSADAALTISVGNISQNATVPLSVVAEYAGGAPQGCHGDLAAATGEGSTSVTAVAPPPPPVEEEVVPQDKGLIPAPALLPAVGAVAVAVLLRRRG